MGCRGRNYVVAYWHVEAGIGHGHHLTKGSELVPSVLEAGIVLAQGALRLVRMWTTVIGPVVRS